jgi:hypothetical protein
MTVKELVEMLRSGDPTKVERAEALMELYTYTDAAGWDIGHLIGFAATTLYENLRNMPVDMLLQTLYDDYSHHFDLEDDDDEA